MSLQSRIGVEQHASVKLCPASSTCNYHVPCFISQWYAVFVLEPVFGPALPNALPLMLSSKKAPLLLLERKFEVEVDVMLVEPYARCVACLG
jgi:hypothetical protein